MGCVFDIQRFCVHDGPGLRTTVFLKGCPLRCRWCSNPESQHTFPELMYNAARCIRCGFCQKSCAAGVITLEANGISLDRPRCRACGACAEGCPAKALVLKGSAMTAGEAEAAALKDADVFASSGGGVTVSGGEPFTQADFLYELLSRFQAAGVHTAVETSAAARWEDIERCLPLVNLVLCDLKHTDAALLKEWTGAEWMHIEKSISAILTHHANALLRIPVIPGFNTDEKSMMGIAAFLRQAHVPQVELLPYHFLGEGKYAMLGRSYAGAAIDGGSSHTDSLRLQEYLASQKIHAGING
ncbi:MAG: glycyl-radical enzyme activating protein [Spirochaetaceae bacterium]|nr:glycyl-radical enzyme activating protein [Spirochaetaceae bacterium]